MDAAGGKRCCDGCAAVTSARVAVERARRGGLKVEAVLWHGGAARSGRALATAAKGGRKRAHYSEVRPGRRIQRGAAPVLTTCTAAGQAQQRQAGGRRVGAEQQHSASASAGLAGGALRRCQASCPAVRTPRAPGTTPLWGRALASPRAPTARFVSAASSASGSKLG